MCERPCHRTGFGRSDVRTDVRSNLLAAPAGDEPSDTQDVQAFLTRERDAFGRAVRTLGITMGQ